jgi:hypothetical protein
MNWRKAMFRVWLIASIAWSGFYLAIALFNYAKGAEETTGGSPSTPLRQFCWAWWCGLSRGSPQGGGDESHVFAMLHKGRWGSVWVDWQDVLMAYEVLK